ncbi:MAG: hypothetical protein UZ22_OP11002000805 [Microgenomates bacterium OLB23]|nr:MAG: hypothetical protein UZ22_OP11002000805 [Microgenomates bacterium OLB23]
MRFNQFTVASRASAVKGDPLTLMGYVEQLQSLDGVLGGKGTIDPTGSITFPRDVVIPVLLQDQFAGWSVLYGEAVVLLGRASDDFGPDDLFIFACTTTALAEELIKEVGPGAYEWGMPGRFMRTWYHECARLPKLPDRLLAENPRGPSTSCWSGSSAATRTAAAAPPCSRT